MTGIKVAVAYGGAPMYHQVCFTTFCYIELYVLYYPL